MLAVTFGILSAACLIYFGIIVVYSGLGTSAVEIWLALSALFFLLSRWDVYYSRHKKQLPLWIPVSISTLCLFGLAVFLIIQVLIFGGMVRSSSEHLDYLIVLGAQVREDDISSSLKRRLDRAIRYVEENPDTKLILSGGQGEGEPTTEAQAMAEYLRYNGVEPEQMLLEMYSTSTKENMVCSKALIEDQQRKKKEKATEERNRARERRMEMDRFLMQTEKRIPEEQRRVSVKMTPFPEEREILPDKPLQIGVLTSNFHLFRAIQIGKKQGFEHLSGVAASADPVLFVHLCVRESVAILKDKFMGNM